MNLNGYRSQTSPAVSGQQRNTGQPGIFLATEHNIHVLHCLTGGTLDQVINHREHYHGITLLRFMYCNPAVVCPAYTAGLRVCARRQHIDELLIMVACLEKRLQVMVNIA